LASFLSPLDRVAEFSLYYKFVIFLEMTMQIFVAAWILQA